MKIVAFSSDKRFELFAKNFQDNGTEIVLLVTQMPKAQGRKQEIRPNFAHQYAIDNKIPVLHPDKLDNKFAKTLQDYDYDLGFIFAYGKIIPQEIIDLFKNGIFNIHFSLLPSLIGPSPIQQALLDNLSETGYTIFKITSKLDCGDVLIQNKIIIEPTDDFDSLREKIIELALQNLDQSFKEYLDGKLSLIPMKTEGASNTHKFAKEDGKITEKDTAQSSYNKIRAFSNWPKTYLEIEGLRLIIHEASLINDKLQISKIQPEGKSIMSFNDFKNGYHSLLTKFPDFVNIS